MADYAVLDLFCGLGGFSQAFDESDRWDVTTVDIEERFDPDICADVFGLRPSDFDRGFDVVLASPPCKCFSKAAAWNNHWDHQGRPQTSDARDAVALAGHTRYLIEGLAPTFWFLENPNGHLQRFLGQPTGRVTYCQYGANYMKPTDLWGRHPLMRYRFCGYGLDCHESSPRTDEAGGGKHPGDALPRDPAERAKVPYDLSESIRDACEAALDGEVPEQQTLAEVGVVGGEQA